MNYLYIIAGAAIISLVVVPLMMAYAEKLGMMDNPGQRRVHSKPIPRVGGWGIVIGTLLPIAALAPLGEMQGLFIFSGLVLLIFGAMDDRFEMGPYAKFGGQFLAAVPMVVLGVLYLPHLPFADAHSLPVWLGMLIAVFCLVGMINATNQSDGLDGLAGGESLLSLCAFAMLSYMVGAREPLMLSLAAVGGTLGFLRYNTHPARVFMGDSGAQFLGFTLGVLAIWLMQVAEPSLSPSLLLFLLGLPVFDFFLVLYVRLRAGQHIFKASKHHLHHRLLSLGFVHHESVVLIYAMHGLMVVTGLWLRNSSDLVLIAAYIALISFFLVMLTRAENSDWKAHRPGETEPNGLAKQIDSMLQHRLLVVWPRRALELLIPLYLVIVSAAISAVPRDFAWVSAVLLVPLVLQFVMKSDWGSGARRIAIYTATVFVVYLCAWDRTGWARQWAIYAEMFYYALVAVCAAIAIRFSPGRRKEEFVVTSLDYLLVFIVICSMLFSDYLPVGGFNIPIFIVALVVMLYAIELLIVERKTRTDWLGRAAAVSLVIIAWRGLDVVRLNINFFPWLDGIIAP